MVAEEIFMFRVISSRCSVGSREMGVPCWMSLVTENIKSESNGPARITGVRRITPLFRKSKEFAARSGLWL